MHMTVYPSHFCLEVGFKLAHMSGSGQAQAESRGRNESKDLDSRYLYTGEEASYASGWH
jgi:hypothetical protein